MRFLIPAFLCVTTPAWAENTDMATQAIDRLQSVLVQQLNDEKSARGLAECITDAATQVELETMATADEDTDAFKVANDVMTRSLVMTCLTEKLTQ
ncbi:MAG: hypothetical protein AAF701_08225 [Pseudomonadota bacterium]